MSTESQRITQARDTTKSSHRLTGNHEPSEMEKLNASGWQHAAVDPLSSSPAGIFALHRLIGNRAVGGMMQPGPTAPTAARWQRAEPHRNTDRGPAIIDLGYQSGTESQASPSRPKPTEYSSFSEQEGPTSSREPAIIDRGYQSGAESQTSPSRPRPTEYSSFSEQEGPTSSREPAIIDLGYQSGAESQTSPSRPKPTKYSSFPEGNGVYQELQFNNLPPSRESAGPTASYSSSIYQSDPTGPESQTSPSRPRPTEYSSFSEQEGPTSSREPAIIDLGYQSGAESQTSPSRTEPATSLNEAGRRSDSPFMTLPKMSAFDDETEENGFWKGQGSPTYYHPSDKPNPYQVDIRGGRLSQGEATLDTHGILPQFNKDKSHRHMFTMSGEGQFYSAEVRKGFEQHGRVHHTTMSGGQEAAAAGEMQVSQGRLEAISDSSGHYRPGAPMTYQALKNLETQGLDLGATNVELSGKKEGEKALSLSATEMMAYQPEMEASLRAASEYRRENPLEKGDREEREAGIRDILRGPEAKIRKAHAKKDDMLAELLQKTASRRQRLDQSGPAPQQGRRDLTEFEYQEAVRGTYQASSGMSRRMTPEQAKAERKELERHWLAQQMRQEQQSARQEQRSAPPERETETVPHYITSEEAAETAPRNAGNEGDSDAAIVDRGYDAAEMTVTETYQ